MPKIKKNKIEQCTKIFIYRDLNDRLIAYEFEYGSDFLTLVRKTTLV